MGTPDKFSFDQVKIFFYEILGLRTLFRKGKNEFEKMRRDWSTRKIMDMKDLGPWRVSFIMFTPECTQKEPIIVLRWELVLGISGQKLSWNTKKLELFDFFDFFEKIVQG